MLTRRCVVKTCHPNSEVISPAIPSRRTHSALPARALLSRGVFCENRGSSPYAVRLRPHDARLTILAGPPGSGKTDRLLARYRTALADPLAGAAVWLSPTWRAAAEVRGRLLDARFDGCFSPGVTTFAKFAQAVLEVAPGLIRPLSRGMKRHLVRRLIDEHAAEGRLRYFAPIASTGGLVDLVCEFISELKRLEIWPEHFRRACTAARNRRQGRRAVGNLRGVSAMAAGAPALRRRGAVSGRRGTTWTSSAGGKQPLRPRFFERLRLVVADGFTDFTRTQHEILEL